MKISVLAENTAHNNSFLCEHGLSLYIETDFNKILFDMGQTNLFEENAKKLGIDLSQVDIAILSHGHYDHGGGLKRFLEINKIAPVFLSRYAFGKHYNSSEKYIGLDPELQKNDRLIYVEDSLDINKQLSLYTCNHSEKHYPVDSYGLTIMQNNTLCADPFLHEQYLLINDGNKKALISGCSHKGVLNVAEWFSPDVFVGGFHFSKLDPNKKEDEKVLHQSARLLLNDFTKYYTCHCTGTEQFNCLKKIMANQIEYISTGKTIIV